MKLTLLGAPGAGKGTQAARISEKLGIPIISTGNILRAAVASGTPVGLRAKAFMDAGELIPDDVIIEIVKEYVSKDDCKNGYIFDGVPRTIKQAEALEGSGIDTGVVLYMEVSDEAILKRMTGRRTCSSCNATFHVEFNPPKTEGVCDLCGGNLLIRPDDKPETVKNRLEVFHRETKPLVDFYAAKGILKRVESSGGLTETIKLIDEALEI